MGNARWNDDSYRRYTSSISDKSRDEVFTSRRLVEALDPKQIKVREAFDSAANPEATPIMLGCDETGSMGVLAETIIRHGLGKIMTSIYTHKPIPDPQILCMGLGDTYVDHAPLQMTQFEASVDPLTQQVAQIWIEGAGGGNDGESYALAWWAAVHKTSCHAIMQRHRKGYLFTIGDESCHPKIPAEHVVRFLGVGNEADVEARAILKEAQRFWNVFHLIVKPVPEQPVVHRWEALLKERAIMVEDHERLPEIIVAIIRLCEGQSNVTDDLDRETARMVTSATRWLLPAGT